MKKITLILIILFQVILLSYGIKTSFSIPKRDVALREKVIFKNKRLHILDENGVYQPFEMKGVTYNPGPFGTWPYGAPDGTNYVCYYDLLNETYSCTESGTYEFVEDYAFDRDFPIIKDMDATSISTYGTPSSSLLEKAAQYGLMVGVTFWHGDMDYTDPSQTDPLKDDFVNYVQSLRNDSNYKQVLFVQLGSEQDLQFCNHGSPGCVRDDQARAYYSFINETFGEAKQGYTTSRPMTIANAKFGCQSGPNSFQTDIGDPNLNADDASLPNLDTWNLHLLGPLDSTWCEGKTLLEHFRAVPTNKPLLLGEIGDDSYNNVTGFFDETAQATSVGNSYDLVKADYEDQTSAVAGCLVTSWHDSGFQDGQGGTPAVWIADTALGWIGGCVGNRCEHELFGLNRVFVPAIPAESPNNPGHYFFDQQVPVPKEVVGVLKSKW